jgi:hypothetical protein
MTYAATTQEILAVPKPDTRHADLVRLSDRLLRQLEALNLAAYAPHLPEQPVPGHRRVVELPPYLRRAINQLRLEVGLPVRRMRNTTQGLEGVWAAQRRLFGQPDIEDEEEETQQ